MTETVIVTETINDVIISSPGPQGARGKTILNGSGGPSSNLGIEGDFYYNTITSEFYGPKLSDTTWSGTTIIVLAAKGSEFASSSSWELAQVQGTGTSRYVVINHNLGFYPNVTVKTSAGDVLETGIDYNSINQITLTMAQPFAGTAYLS